MAFQLPQLLLVPSLQLTIPKLHEVVMDQDTLEYSGLDSYQNGFSSHSLLSSSKKISKNSTRKDKYQMIPNELRIELVNAVINKKEKLKRAAARLGINYSSAKSIYQVFRREGRFDKKGSKKDQAQNGLVEKISLGTNFINQSLETQKDAPVELAPRQPEIKVERIKPLEPLAVPKFTLAELENLAPKMPKSETMSTCSMNGLYFSRNCSGDSEIAQPGYKVAEPMTFFQFLENKEQGNELGRRNSAFSKVSKQKSENSTVRQLDIHIPEYQAVLSHYDARYQFQEKNLLIQDPHPISYELNQLRSTNNVLLQLRNQALLPFEEAQQRIIREQKVQYNLVNSFLEERISAILERNNLVNKNLQVFKPAEFEVIVNIPPLKLSSNFQ